jgi:hypothetical protein
VAVVAVAVVAVAVVAAGTVLRVFVSTISLLL